MKIRAGWNKQKMEGLWSSFVYMRGVWRGVLHLVVSTAQLKKKKKLYSCTHAHTHSHTQCSVWMAGHRAQGSNFPPRTVKQHRTSRNLENSKRQYACARSAPAKRVRTRKTIAGVCTSTPICYKIRGLTTSLFRLQAMCVTKCVNLLG